MADVILRFGPNNLGEERELQDFMLWLGQLWRKESLIPVRDPDFLQVVFSEGEEHLQVDVLLLQQRKILGAANLFQELCQILQGREHSGHHKDLDRSKAKQEETWTKPLVQCRTMGVQQVTAARSSPGRHCEQCCCSHDGSCFSSGGLSRLCESCSSCTDRSPGGNKGTDGITATTTTELTNLFEPDSYLIGHIERNQ